MHVRLRSNALGYLGEEPLSILARDWAYVVGNTECAYQEDFGMALAGSDAYLPWRHSRVSESVFEAIQHCIRLMGVSYMNVVMCSMVRGSEK